MIKVIMHGCNGKMGQVISNLIQNDTGIEIVAGIDLPKDNQLEYPFFTSLEVCTIKADVIIDFSSATVVDKLIHYAVDKQIPVVLCTTGLDQEQLKMVKEASEKVAILRSANMSLGINTLVKLLKDAANILAPAGFDIEIIEKHHNLKEDAPSGTALALADAINEARDGEYEYIYDRSSVRKPRDKKELGISVVRGGTIIGEHEVIFAGIDEVITISHSSYSRTIFGKGAVEAAKFLAGKEAGMYNMSDMM